MLICNLFFRTDGSTGHLKFFFFSPYKKHFEISLPMTFFQSINCDPMILGGLALALVVCVAIIVSLSTGSSKPKSATGLVQKRINDQNDAPPVYRDNAPAVTCGLDQPYTGATCPAQYATQRDGGCYFNNCRAKTEFEYKQAAIEGSSAGRVFLGPIADKNNVIGVSSGTKVGERYQSSGIQMERIVAGYNNKKESEFLKQIKGQESVSVDPEKGIPPGAGMVELDFTH